MEKTIEEYRDDSIKKDVVSMLSGKTITKKKLDETIKYVRVYKHISLEEATKYVQDIKNSLV